MMTPTDSVIAPIFRCMICDALMGTCACWTSCRQCGRLYRTGGECRNPNHRKPPRDVPCPYCSAAVGTPCRQRNGIVQSWPHHLREVASKAKEEV